MGSEFKPGDKVEIMVTPQGVVTSVQPLTGGYVDNRATERGESIQARRNWSASLAQLTAEP